MTQTTDVLIVGTGFSGLGMAINLIKAGRDDFVILEKATDVGGTWRDNSYPGCECDIPSHMYSFSYELNPEWSKSFSGAAEIWEYLRDVAQRHRLAERTQFGVEMSGATWDETRGRWTVHTSNGDYDCRVLVAGVGGLHLPKTPTIPGIDSFRGEAFHSAQWRHDLDLTGKRVAVIGTGASAIQFIPIIAQQTGHLTVFQRTPAWVMPKRDRPTPEWRKQLFRTVPGAQRAYRDALYLALESRAVGFNGQVNILAIAEKVVQRHLAKAIPDPATRRALTPDYRMGCKRILQSNTYYPTYARDDVDLVTGGVREIQPDGVVDADGVLHEADVIVWGTGFHVVDAFDYLTITGREGKDLAKTFQTEGVETYLGMGIAGFPNLYFMLGPNTALGHNSVVFMIEQQAKYIVRMLAEMDRQDATVADVREDVQRAYNDEVQDKVSKGIWTQGGCTSWYLDSQGKNRTIWPGFTFMYWWATRTVDPEAYAWETVDA